MHPKIVFPGELAPLIQELARPLYEGSQREAGRLPDPESEVSLAGGYRLDAADFAGERHLDVLLEDLRQFMAVAMEVRETADGYPVRLTRGEVPGSPPGSSEQHGLRVSPESCEVVAPDLDGLRRGVFRLQDEMRLRRSPILPLGETIRWAHIGPRISRSPIAPYRWLSGWELEDDNDYYPDAYLCRLAHCGVNGIWVTGLLRNLVASKTIPELGPETHRLDKLNELIARAARYGIRVYLFCIEPRALPGSHPARLAHPEIVGAHGSPCPSRPVVLEYVREVMRELFTEAPDLAGIINIFNSERATTCWLNEDYAQDCPRCRERPQAEVLGETLSAFMEGIREASSTAEFLAWTYMMDPKTHSMTTLPIEPMLKVMRESRPDIVWLGNFEHGGVKELCGKRIEVHEYSLSYVGPSQNFTDLASEARATGRRVFAKLQVSTSYELATVPHVPVPGIVYDKFAAMDEHGARGTMLGWIPGGFPGPMLKAAGEAAFHPRPPKQEFLRRLAAITWGEKQASQVASAWDVFADAWQDYPFNNAVLYFSPLTRGPAYQYHLEREPRLAKPYNWGYERTRKPQPFEDHVERWLGPYSVEEIVQSFRRMADNWLDGLRKLEAALGEAGSGRDLEKQVAVAAAIRLQYLAAADGYEFYSLRDGLRGASEAEHPALLRRMREVAEQSIGVAEEMKQLMSVDPAIGYQSEIFTYSYSVPLLAEKIVQVRDLLNTLTQWEQTGVDAEVLERTVEEAERLRPDRCPDRWGD